MHLLVDSLLEESTDYDINLEDPYFGGKKCVIFSLISNGGILSKTSGFDEVKKIENVIAMEQRRKTGELILNNGSLKQIVFRFVIEDSDLRKIVDSVKKIQLTVKAYDENGKDMLINEFDPEILLKSENQGR